MLNEFCNTYLPSSDYEGMALNAKRAVLSVRSTL
jgi:hypothetical protein